jgi:hypothetical protein
MTRGIFETTDIDLASFLEASTGRTPSVFRDMATGLATFHFRNDSEIEEQIVAYATGTAVANVRRLLSSRRRLFHEVRSVQREVQP